MKQQQVAIIGAAVQVDKPLTRQQLKDGHHAKIIPPERNARNESELT